MQVQGPVSVGGFSLGGGDAGSVQKNHTVVGNIPNGGLVTAEIERLQDMDGHIELLLFEGKGNSLIRAQDIILELMYALDQQLLDDGNELALNLQRLYLYCYRRLVRANTRLDRAAIEEVIELFTISSRHGGKWPPRAPKAHLCEIDPRWSVIDLRDQSERAAHQLLDDTRQQLRQVGKGRRASRGYHRQPFSQEARFVDNVR